MDRLVLAFVALSACSGCELFCGAQANCIAKTWEVAVVDAETGAGVPGATLSQTYADGRVERQYFTSCEQPADGCFGGFGTGRFAIRAEADGYAAAEFALDVGRDLCSRAIEQRRVVELAKVGSSARPRVTEEQALFQGCQ